MPLFLRVCRHHAVKGLPYHSETPGNLTNTYPQAGIHPTEDFKDAPVMVRGQFDGHHYQPITNSKKGKNQGEK
jgi:hypothetical protein